MNHALLNDTRNGIRESIRKAEYLQRWFDTATTEALLHLDRIERYALLAAFTLSQEAR